MGKNQHVMPRPDGKWQVIGEDNSKATHTTDTQQQSIELAREIAINQKSELIIHGRDGKIREKTNYGGDSCRSKG